MGDEDQNGPQEGHEKARRFFFAIPSESTPDESAEERTPDAQ